MLILFKYLALIQIFLYWLKVKYTSKFRWSVAMFSPFFPITFPSPVSNDPLPRCLFISLFNVYFDLYISILMVLDPGSQLGVVCPWDMVNCCLKFKFHYLRNLKPCSISVKEIYEPIDLFVFVFCFSLFCFVFCFVFVLFCFVLFCFDLFSFVLFFPSF